MTSLGILLGSINFQKRKYEVQRYVQKRLRIERGGPGQGAKSKINVSPGEVICGELHYYVQPSRLQMVSKECKENRRGGYT